MGGSKIIQQVLIVCIMTISGFDIVNSETPARWQQVEPPVMGCNQQLQTHIAMQTNLTLDAIDQFKQHYAWNKFDVNWEDAHRMFNVSQDLEFLLVSDEANECQRVLPELPSPPYITPTTESEAGRQMAQILEISQQYAYALEILFLDQSLHEDSFQSHVDDIYHSLENLIGSLIFGLKQCEVPVTDSNIRTLMGKVYRGANTVLRDQRAFRTVRQCHLGLQYIRHFFSMNDSHPLLR